MARWPFRDSTFIDSEDEQWQIELWRWFLERFASQVDFRKNPLVLPTSEFFPPTGKTGHDRAEHIFRCVQRLARMPDWPCRLEAQPHRPELRVGDYLALKPIKQGPLGTFGWDGEQVMITYDPSALDQPVKLIATFAHELAHYLLAGSRADIPGGEELHEPATDLLTVYMGFGVFGAASAFEFHSSMTGWGWSAGGYISQRAWIFALAIFLELRGENAAAVKPYFKTHLFSDLGDGVRYLRRKQKLAGMVIPSV